MKWKKITIETRTAAEELVGAMLLELGIDSFEVEDKRPLSEEDKKRMFIDILPDTDPDDGIAYLSFYSDEDVDLTDLLEKLQNGFAALSAYGDPGTGKIIVSETEDKDWINNWKEFFKPFRVDDSIVIKPTWEILENQKETDLVIELDPGTAFGTGAHETTKLCIGSLKRYVKTGSHVLDLGCGSGILSILCRKLGASLVLGTDIDSNAVLVAKENCEVNKLIAEASIEGPEKSKAEAIWKAAAKGCGFFCCDILKEQEARNAFENKFDLIAANILADVIIPFAEIVGNFLKPGGYFISSGIINTKAEEVKQALLAAHWTMIEENWMGDWVSYTAKKTLCNSVKM